MALLRDCFQDARHLEFWWKREICAIIVLNSQTKSQFAGILTNGRKAVQSAQLCKTKLRK